MRPTYIIAPEAERDIEEVWNYVASDNENAARRLVAEFYDAFERLSEMPGLGHTRKDLTARNLLFWSLRRRYVVIYRELPDVIEIVRVLDGHRDVAALLR